MDVNAYHVIRRDGSVVIDVQVDEGVAHRFEYKRSGSARLMSNAEWNARVMHAHSLASILPMGHVGTFHNLPKLFALRTRLRRERRDIVTRGRVARRFGVGSVAVQADAYRRNRRERAKNARIIAAARRSAQDEGFAPRDGRGLGTVQSRPAFCRSRRFFSTAPVVLPFLSLQVEDALAKLERFRSFNAEWDAQLHADEAGEVLADLRAIIDEAWQLAFGSVLDPRDEALAAQEYTQRTIEAMERGMARRDRIQGGPGSPAIDADIYARFGEPDAAYHLAFEEWLDGKPTGMASSRKADVIIEEQGELHTMTIDLMVEDRSQATSSPVMMMAHQSKEAGWDMIAAETFTPKSRQAPKRVVDQGAARWAVRWSEAYGRLALALAVECECPELALQR